MLGDLAIGIGRFEIQPRVRVDELETGQLSRVGHALREIERPEAVMGRCGHDGGEENSENSNESIHQESFRSEIPFPSTQS